MSKQTDLSVILDGIEERANKATPGPWYSKLDADLSRRVIFSGESIVNGELIGAGVVPENADFITASRTDVPALVKALREAVDQRDENVVKLADMRAYDAELTAILQPSSEPKEKEN